MKGLSKNRIIWGLFSLFLLLFIFTFRVYAQDGRAEIVRVGYYENEGCEEGGS